MKTPTPTLPEPPRHAGVVSAPPYWVKRQTASNQGVPGAADVPIGVRPIAELQLWKESFPGQVDWQNGWKIFWGFAGGRLHSWPEEVTELVVGLIQLFFEDQQLSAVVGVPWQPGGEAIAASIKRRLDSLRGGRIPTAGLVGVLWDGEGPNNRPGVTFMTSGPGGGMESARLVSSALDEALLTAAVTCRAIRDDEIGIVNMVFAPEIYRFGSAPSFGFDWGLWSQAAQEAPALAWGTACLIWCDEVARATRLVRREAGLMIDRVQFDFYKMLALSELPPLSDHDGFLEVLARALDDPREAE